MGTKKYLACSLFEHERKKAQGARLMAQGLSVYYQWIPAFAGMMGKVTSDFIRKNENYVLFFLSPCAMSLAPY